MTNGLAIFPEDYREYVARNTTDQPVLGENYISSIKALQALEHYSARNESYDDILAKVIEASPYVVLGMVMNQIIKNATAGLENRITEKVMETQIAQPQVYPPSDILSLMQAFSSMNEENN